MNRARQHGLVLEIIAVVLSIIALTVAVLGMVGIWNVSNCRDDCRDQVSQQRDTCLANFVNATKNFTDPALLSAAEKKYQECLKSAEKEGANCKSTCSPF